jgi:hypothetical protein
MSGSERKQGAIECPACGAESLLRRTPRYEGLTRVGDELSCLACGHVFENEDAVPFKAPAASALFTDADRSAPVAVFRADEHGRLCRHCREYVVNPFRQWCGRHRREVEATDTCADFRPPEEKKDPLGGVAPRGPLPNGLL